MGGLCDTRSGMWHYQALSRLSCFGGFVLMKLKWWRAQQLRFGVNSSTSKISLVILFTICHTILMMLVKKIFFDQLIIHQLIRCFNILPAKHPSRLKLKQHKVALHTHSHNHTHALSVTWPKSLSCITPVSLINSTVPLLSIPETSFCSNHTF